MIAMIEKIAHRQGFGKLLAEGSQRAAAKIGKGSEAYLVTVKGTEAPAHMPQAKRSLGLIYAVNPFGADHQSSEHDPMYEEGAGELYLKRLALLGLTEPQPVYEMTDEKVRFAYWTEVFYSAMDTLCLCQFVWGPAWSLYGPAELVAMLQAATGWNFSLAEVIEIGMRRLNMMRAFNLREGFTREQDVLPIKFSKPLEGTGPTAGMALDPVALEHFKDIYYSLAGWDVATGNPTAKRLAELGLDWVTIN
jgi:aldehyde:ferredoxin oxidoreductase